MMRNPRPCDVEDRRDFEQYYRNTYMGRMEDDGTIIPYLVQGRIDGDIFRLHNSLSDQSEDMSFTSRISKEFCFGTPPLGCVNVIDSYVFTYCFPVRESTKGLQLNRVHTFLPDERGLFYKMLETRGLSLDYLKIDKEFLYSLFNPKFFDFKEAYALLQQGERIGCAVSGRFGIFSTQRHAHPLVSFKRRIVGYTDGKEVVFNPTEDHTRELFIKKIKGLEGVHVRTSL